MAGKEMADCPLFRLPPKDIPFLHFGPIHPEIAEIDLASHGVNANLHAVQLLHPAAQQQERTASLGYRRKAERNAKYRPWGIQKAFTH